MPLTWLTPEANEPIDSYAGRMRARISGERPVLLGVSFGGMMAIEIAKELPGATVVIVGKDRMFPIKKVQPTHVIPDGSHLMVFNRAAAVSAVLRQLLS